MSNSQAVGDWLRAVLRGVGQIMLQPSAATGVLFLMGIGVVSPKLMLACFGGSLLGTLTGRALKAKEADVSNGIYGYNSALVALATLYFFQISVPVCVLFVVGSALAAIVTKVIVDKWPLPAYTAPFVLVTWGVLWIGKTLGVEAASNYPSLFEFEIAPALASLTGIGQVMFQKSALSGLLFLMGVAACAKYSAGWVLVGSTLGGMLAVMIPQVAGVDVENGLYGYNAALAALAVGLVDKRMWPPVAAALATVPLMFLCQSLEASALTGPFVIASWAVLLIVKRKG